MNNILLIFPVLFVVVYGSWDLSENQRMLQFSAAAYCSESSIQNWSCGHCASAGNFNISTLLFDDSTNTFGFVGIDTTAQMILVSFRGTEPTSLKNWITDLSFPKTTVYPDIPGAEVHEGFLEAYMTINDTMIAAVSQLVTSYPSYSVHVTGHSLGAALCVLSALNIARVLGVSVSVYNYGDPRVGNQVFADYFDSIVPDLFRVVNENDIVPHLPPRSFGFWHVATEAWYNNNQYTICDGSGEDPTCSDSQIDLSIPDHVDYMGVLMGIGGC